MTGIEPDSNRFNDMKNFENWMREMTSLMMKNLPTFPVQIPEETKEYAWGKKEQQRRTIDRIIDDLIKLRANL